MISCDSLNKVFGSLAKFVSRLTGKEVGFQQVKPGESLDSGFWKMNNLLEGVVDALDNSEVKVVGALEPGKIYCLQTDMSSVNMEWIGSMADYLVRKDIFVILLDQNMNFISIPEGYTVIKED